MDWFSVLAGGRVGQLVDAVLMIVRGDEDHVGDVVVGDELEQRIALRAVAAHVGLAAVGVHRGVGASRAEAREIVQRERAADRPDLVDRVGDRNELPRCAGVLRVEQGLLQPGELSGSQVGAARVVGARRAGVVRAAVGRLDAEIAVGAGVGVDVDRVLAPLLGEIELLRAVRARVGRVR